MRFLSFFAAAPQGKVVAAMSCIQALKWNVCRVFANFFDQTG
jgi:hypothetical protein